jgi:histidine ammonia-lyase
LFLPLIGLGKVFFNGKIQDTASVLQLFGLEPIALHAKEGLALINGTQFMAAHGIKAVVEMNRLMDNADLIATLMVEGLNGSMKPFSKKFINYDLTKEMFL